MSIQILPLTLTFSGRTFWLQLRSAPFFCPGISNRSNQKTSIQKIIKSVRALTRRSMDIVEVATVSPPRRLNRDLAASRQSIDLVLQDPAMDTPPRRCPTPGDDSETLRDVRTTTSCRQLYRGTAPRNQRAERGMYSFCC